MDRKFFSLFAIVILFEIIIDLVNGADNKPVQSVFIFSNYKSIEEVKNNKILTSEYVYQLSPEQMLQVCANIAKSTHFQLNGYKFIRGVPADRMRNYKVAYSNFGKRQQISAFRCPIDRPVYVQHRGRMIWVYVKKPKNYECSNDHEYKVRSASYKSPFHRFFSRVKRFFGIKSHRNVRNINGLICLGNNIDIALTTFTEGSGSSGNQPWVVPRVKLESDIIHEINAHVGSGVIRFQGQAQPGEHEENEVVGGRPILSVIGSESDTLTNIKSKHFLDEDIHQSSDHRLWNSFQSNSESKINLGEGEKDFETYTSTIQASQLPSSMKFQNDRPVHVSSDNSAISFGSSSVKTFSNIEDTSNNRGSRTDFAKDDYIRGEETLKVSIRPATIDATAKIYAEESEFGSISSLPTARL